MKIITFKFYLLIFLILNVYSYADGILIVTASSSDNQALSLSHTGDMLSTTDLRSYGAINDGSTGVKVGEISITDNESNGFVLTFATESYEDIGYRLGLSSSSGPGEFDSKTILNKNSGGYTITYNVRIELDLPPLSGSRGWSNNDVLGGTNVAIYGPTGGSPTGSVIIQSPNEASNDAKFNIMIHTLTANKKLFDGTYCSTLNITISDNT